MTLSDLQTEVSERMGNRTDLDSMIRRVARRIQPTVLEGHSFKPWFMVTEVADAQATKDETRLPLPQDFIEEYEEGALWVVVDGKERALQKKDLDDIRGKFEESGVPKYYALTGDYLRFAPAPDKAYEVRMIYLASQPLLDEEGDTNDWLKWAYDVVVSEVGLRVASELRDERKMQEFGQERQGAWARLRTQHEARLHANRAYQMGG